MSQSNLPRLQQPLFKNKLQKHQIALRMHNYKRKLYEIQQSKSKFPLSNNINNQQTIQHTYRQLFQENHKKNYMLQTKYMQIQRQNKFLFQKISKIHQERSYFRQDKSNQRMKSLNITIRKKQVQDIQHANTKMFERIQRQKPSISFKNIDKEYLKTRKFSQKLSKIEKYKIQDWY